MDCENDPTTLLYDILTAELEAALPGSTTPLPAANENVTTSSPSSRSQVLLSAGEVQEEGELKRNKRKHRGGRKYRKRWMRMRQKNKEEQKDELQWGVESPRKDFATLRRQQHEGGVRRKVRRRKYRERTPLLTYDEPGVGNPAHRSPSPHSLHYAPRDPLYRQRSRSPSSSFGQQPSGHEPDVLGYQSHNPPRSNALDSRRKAAAAAAESESQVAPETAYNLARYSRGISRSRDNNTRSGGKDDLGKVGVWYIGSTPDKDLGLCYATFVTPTACRSGTSCLWRHHPLSQEEKVWICGNGRAGFLNIVGDCWATPGVPVPGANLLKVADWETG